MTTDAMNKSVALEHFKANEYPEAQFYATLAVHKVLEEISVLLGEVLERLPEK